MVGFSLGAERASFPVGFGLREPRCSRGRVLCAVRHRLARPRARCIRGELSSGNRAFRASAFVVGALDGFHEEFHIQGPFLLYGRRILALFRW